LILVIDPLKAGWLARATLHSDWRPLVAVIADGDRIQRGCGTVNLAVVS